MKLHEYQAKALLRSCGVPAPDGAVADTPEAAEGIARSLGDGGFLVKAQIHAGGRGKAGGVKAAKTPEGVFEAARSIIGMRIVNNQTGPAGKLVSRVLVERAAHVERELYFGALVDRERRAVAVIACAEGGVEIEEVAKRAPDRILREGVNPATGLMPYQQRNLCEGLGLSGPAAQGFSKLAARCAAAFFEKDLSLLEINPLAVTPGGGILALDAKIAVDDSALFRQKDLAAQRDLSEEDPREIEASRNDLSYIGLDGSIGCLVNGAGLAMATMDIIRLHGGRPANFLDVGGGATVEAITAGFRVILADPGVRAVLVNIFGGIMRCDVVAKSIVAAAGWAGIRVPLVVRLQGNSADEGRRIIEKSGIPVITASTMEEAAERAVRAAGG